MVFVYESDGHCDHITDVTNVHRQYVTDYQTNSMHMHDLLIYTGMELWIEA